MNKNIVAFLFSLSGLCGLMYEILWTRQFSHILGNTYIAISIIIASFMFGLFLGAWLVGRYIHKCKNELRWYGYLEVIIGIYAILLLLLFGGISNIYHLLYNSLSGVELLHLIGKFFVTLLFLVIPTSAMGATLPLIVQYFTRTKKVFGDNISLFYSVNTVGGATGVTVAGFLLIEHLGIAHSLMLTALLNILIGISIFLLLKNQMDSSFSEPNRDSKDSAAQTGQITLTEKVLFLSAAGLAGFAALSYEVMWVRGLRFLVHNTTYSFSAILFIFLLGIAIGAKIAQRIISNGKRLEFIYGVLQFALGIYALFTIVLLYQFFYSDVFQNNIVEIIYDYSYNWMWIILIYILVAAILCLPPTIIMGILFPLINDIYFENTALRTGKTVSIIFAINTIGAILGSLCAGYFLLPAFGIRCGLIIISMINLLLGSFFILKSRHKVFTAFAVNVIVLLFIYSLTLDAKYLYGRGERESDRILFYKEGLMATVKVFERNNVRSMSIDGVNIASTGAILMQKEKLIAHLPFFIKSDIKQVLSVGLASGISTGAMSLHQGVQEIDCVELIKPVFPAARFFLDYNYNIFHNPKINLYHNDVYAFLKYSDKKYDLISSDGKLGTFYSGNTLMLSQDYYELCKARLADRGLFIQWVPIITPHKVFLEILATLDLSFKHISLFHFYPSDIFMIASDSPITFDSNYMEQVFSDTDILKELEKFYIKNANSIMTSYIGDYDDGDREDVPIISINKPIIEFQYLREWKKSRDLDGGYRAKNLQYLIGIYEKTSRRELNAKFIDMEPSRILNDIYLPSLDFFKFCETNFKIGNFQQGLWQYIIFKEKQLMME